MEQRKQLINQATAAVEAKKYDRVSSNQKIEHVLLAIQEIA